MKKRFILILLCAAMLLTFAACGQKKTVHCDRCGSEITRDADSNITEEWIVFCAECEEEAFGDNPVVSPGSE